MVQPGYETLSVRRQCELLHLARSGLSYVPVEASAEELALMRRIDAIYLERPYYGRRRMTVALQREGHEVNHKHVQRLMRVMGLEGMAPGPHTSRPHPEHVVYPYLLRGLEVVRPDQVWAADITYIPLAQGWAYLVAVIDWFSRAVLAWRLSNTLCTEFCVEALVAPPPSTVSLPPHARGPLADRPPSPSGDPHATTASTTPATGDRPPSTQGGVAIFWCYVKHATVRRALNLVALLESRNPAETP